MDLKGGENGRTASWLGHICCSGRHERSRHKRSAGAAPAATTRTSSLERRTLLVDTLTVLKFPEADGADRMIHKLEDLHKQELI